MDYTIHYKAEKIEQLLDKMNTLHIPEAVPVYTRDSAVADIDDALERFRSTVVVPAINSTVTDYINALDSYDEPVAGQYVSAVSETDGKIVVSRESLPAMPTIPVKVSAFENDANYLTEHQSLEAYAKKTDLPVIPTKVSAFTNDKGYLTESSLSDYAKKSELPVVPTNVSAFINDAGYITTGDIPTKTSDLTNDSDFITHADLPTVPTKVSELTNDSNFATVPQLDSKAVELQGNIDTVDSKVTFVSDAVSAVTSRVINVEAGLLDKQDILHAGANITIDSATNVISASFIQSQSDWAQTDAAKPDFIQNKPVLNIADWDTAAGLAHTHDNQETLDSIQTEDVNVWNTAVVELINLESELPGMLDAKQDALTAGTGITIEDNVISATEGHTHANKSTLDLIGSDKVSYWDGKQQKITIGDDGSARYLSLDSTARLKFDPTPIYNDIETNCKGRFIDKVTSIMPNGRVSGIEAHLDYLKHADDTYPVVTLNALDQWISLMNFPSYKLTAGTNVSISDNKINVDLTTINSAISSLTTAVNSKISKINPGDNITVTQDSAGIVTIAAASVSPTWGSIEGTLSSQADLNAELNDIKSSVSTKQDKLTAGSNISISGSTISVTGMHSHSNKNLLDNIKSTDIYNWDNKVKCSAVPSLNIVFVDSLPASPAANTLYFVKE